MNWSWHPRSVRTYLLAWIISPIAIFIVIDTYTLYRNALDSVNTAYDRMLIASAHSIGDLLRVENNRLTVSLPRAAMEIYEADKSGKMIYRINGFDRKFLSGDENLPEYKGKQEEHASYPALVHIYEDYYNGEPVRIAALFQPVLSNDAQGSALIQVAETLEHRTELAREVLWNTLILQAILLAVVALVIMLVVTHALKPLAALRKQLDEREPGALQPLVVPNVSTELQPVVGSLNQLMTRLHRLLDHQQRFVANASHQLRTPLAVLKTQLQSGLRGDVARDVIMEEMVGTVDRATNLTNQLLSLAKVEQLRGRGKQTPCDLAMLARETAVDLSPLISEKNLDFELEVERVQVLGHPWMIGELISNLLHNAIRHTPANGRLGIRMRAEQQRILLCVWDTGSGIAKDMQSSSFEPFASSSSSKGGGLGLTICSEIADSIGAHIVLANRVYDGVVTGLDAMVEFPVLHGDAATLR